MILFKRLNYFYEHAWLKLFLCIIHKSCCFLQTLSSFINARIAFSNTKWVTPTLAAISGLLQHLDISSVKIGVGGALIQFHPTFHDLLEQKLKELAPKHVTWSLVPADEGSARGAALIAAVAEKMHLWVISLALHHFIQHCQLELGCQVNFLDFTFIKKTW